MKTTSSVRCGFLLAAVLAGSTCLILSACDQQPTDPGPSQPAPRTPNNAPVAKNDTGDKASPGDATEHIRPGQQNGGAGVPAPTGPASVGIRRDGSSPSRPTTPPTTPPSNPPTPPADSGSPTEAQFAGFAGPKPATWQFRAPAATSTMRVAEYSVPGVDGADQAQIVVYQFPGGGSVEDNVKRWKDQVKNADGTAAEQKVETITVGDMTVTVSEATGMYRGMGMPEAKPDYTLMASMVQADGDPVFVYLSGPSKTVAANREAFLTLLRGLKRAEPMK